MLYIKQTWTVDDAEKKVGQPGTPRPKEWHDSEFIEYSFCHIYHRLQSEMLATHKY